MRFITLLLTAFISLQSFHQTVGTTETEEELDLNYMIGAPAKQEVRYAMSNSLGFGGHNGTLLVKKYEED